MDYKLEFWNEDGQGSKYDLVDNNTGNILFPYSQGMISVLYFSSDKEPDEYEIIEELENTKGTTIDMFIKSDKYENFKINLSNYQISVLYLLNFHSHIYLTDENGLKLRVKRVKFQELDKFYGYTVCQLGMLFENNTISIAGK